MNLDILDTTEPGLTEAEIQDREKARTKIFEAYTAHPARRLRLLIKKGDEIVFDSSRQNPFDINQKEK
ncbi:MAG TPA: hypothetical protein PKD56_15030 [Chitinophagales bacterium]|nr:hypothetical protein [Chitinophagales bacterium]